MEGLGMNNNRFFQKQTELIDELSKNIITNLEDAIKINGKASLLVSGGSTPKPLFKKLSTFDIAWDKVTIALCDERWVQNNHEDSNERFVKELLLIDFARKAKFVPMYQEGVDIENAQQICSDIYKNELFPFDVTILGMGSDGHTASLFPNNIKLEESFNDETKLCICMEPDTAPHKRMSLTKNAILSSNNIYLHFEGEEKQAVYKKVLDGVDKNEMPISSIINQNKKSIEVYYR
jgi:6-phosphogluconolactonase